MTDGLFKNFFRLSIGPIGILATILATAVVTTLGNSYVNLIQHNRTVVEADFAKFKETSGEFFQLLEAYSRLARDGTPVDESTKNSSPKRCSNFIMKRRLSRNVSLNCSLILSTLATHCFPCRLLRLSLRVHSMDKSLYKLRLNISMQSRSSVLGSLLYKAV
jgi:hypothetical protein